jgi:ribonuclease J
VVACFSSHIHRIQQVVNAARGDERVVAFLGRSMHQSVEAARRLGILHVPETDVITIEEVEHRDPSRVVVICTGSQGEPFSALSLMAAREHKWVKLGGDNVVLSSLIPGRRRSTAWWTACTGPAPTCSTSPPTPSTRVATRPPRSCG